jgi:hypothetical protein
MKVGIELHQIINAPISQSDDATRPVDRNALAQKKDQLGNNKL